VVVKTREAHTWSTISSGPFRLSISTNASLIQRSASSESCLGYYWVTSLATTAYAPTQQR
jgi:hypothetical protein